MMNNKIYNENKLSIYVVSVAFFLSLIIGIIAGNPGGIVLMRAFLSAILFGIIFQGGIYLIRKYVPEIKTLKEPAAERSSILDRTEAAGKRRTILERLELGFGKWVVVGNVRSGVALYHAQV